MGDMRARIERGDIAAERREGIEVGNTLIKCYMAPVGGVSVLIFTFLAKAMCDIAADRARMLLQHS